MEDCFANDYTILEPLEGTELINYLLIKKSHKSRVKVIFDKSKGSLQELHEFSEFILVFIST